MAKASDDAPLHFSLAVVEITFNKENRTQLFRSNHLMSGIKRDLVANDLANIRAAAMENAINLFEIEKGAFTSVTIMNVIYLGRMTNAQFSADMDPDTFNLSPSD